MAAPAVQAQEEFTDPVLQGELWMPFQPLLPTELERRVPDQEKLDALLEEMQAVFSGMVYGWSFTYRPADPARQVPDFLDVKPLGRIAAGNTDPAKARALAVSSRVDSDQARLTVLFRYYMPAFEAARRQAWASFNLEQAAGTGRARITDRSQSRLQALQQALKEAVRALLRPRLYNRPQQISGEAVLREVPRYGIEADWYVCSGRFQVRVLNVRDYPLN